MPNQINLDLQQLDQLRSITAGGTANFAAGYRYVLSIIRDVPYVDANTKYWFEQAANINSNHQGSAANTFIRTVTATGLTLDGRTVDAQTISDAIGRAVIGDILGLAQGIRPYAEIIQNDVGVAIGGFGQTYAGWGGSVANWNVPINAEFSGQTIGQWITARPVELERFIASNAAALRATLRDEVGQPWNQQEWSDTNGLGR